MSIFFSKIFWAILAHYTFQFVKFLNIIHWNFRQRFFFYYRTKILKLFLNTVEICFCRSLKIYEVSMEGNSCTFQRHLLWFVVLVWYLQVIIAMSLNSIFILLFLGLSTLHFYLLTFSYATWRFNSLISYPNPPSPLFWDVDL